MAGGGRERDVPGVQARVHAVGRADPVARHALLRVVDAVVERPAILVVGMQAGRTPGPGAGQDAVAPQLAGPVASAKPSWSWRCSSDRLGFWLRITASRARASASGGSGAGMVSSMRGASGGVRQGWAPSCRRFMYSSRWLRYMKPARPTNANAAT